MKRVLSFLYSWVVVPAKALGWSLRNLLRRGHTYAVSWRDHNGRLRGDLIRARSWEEARGIAGPRGYKLDGRVYTRIEDGPFLRFVFKLFRK
jgi:hypothetical protein